MSETQQLSSEDLETDYYYQASVSLRSGRSRTDTLSELSSLGVDAATARRLVDEAYGNLSEIAIAEELTFKSLFNALAGAAGGALLGALVWWQVMVWTGYEIGLMATVVGWLAGLGTSIGANKKRGFTLQCVAVGAAVGGIVLGNFLIFVHAVRAHVAQTRGVEAADALGLTQMPLLFLGSLLAMLDGWNALWILLAVITSWQMLKGENIRLNPEPVPDQTA